MDIAVVCEDEEIIVLNKPSGIVVNRSENEKNNTVQDWIETHHKYILKYNNPTDAPFRNRSGLVHRIDKDTSGLLLIAKTPFSFFNFQKQFKEKTVVKKYFALVSGALKAKEGTIKAPVGRLPWDRMKFGVLSTGREAETSFKVISLYNFMNKYYTLLEVMPLTGRTHQIRIHLKYYGFPVVSDRLYSGRVGYRENLEFCPRLFLHSFFLQVIHPIAKKRVVFETILPIELSRILETFNKIELY